MTALAQCLSHSPMLMQRSLGAVRDGVVQGALAEARRTMAEFDPELVIVFGPDHYNGFFYELMPPFCIGAAASGIGDYGTRKGPLEVDTASATALHEFLLAADFDMAISHEMRIDHAFTQAMEQLFAAPRAFVPIFINCVGKPLASTRRVMALGDAVGRYARASGKRVALIGSGGLSHDAPLPSLDTVPPEMRNSLIERRLLTPDERALREARTIAAADQFARNESPLTPLNEAWDRTFMDHLAHDRRDVLAAMQDADITREGGRSGHEIRAWLAALAAVRACGPTTIEQSVYVKAPEWIVGYGVMRARAAT